MSRDSNTEHLEIRADLYWALIPEWVLYAEISANAVRMYGILARHADKDTRQCHPTRATLAQHLRTSRATVDRALDELVGIGAVTVKQRKSSKGDWTSNVYVVRTIPPTGVYSQVTTPLLTGDETGLLTSDEQTRVSTNTESRRTRSNKSNAGDQIAKDWWEAQNPRPLGKGAWHSLLTVCRGAAAAGWEGDKIRTALNRIGTVPSAAQLDRELRNRRPETWSERKAREEREEAERIAALRERERLESEERFRRVEEERAQAVPPPPEFLEMVKRLRSGKAAS